MKDIREQLKIIQDSVFAAARQVRMIEMTLEHVNAPSEISKELNTLFRYVNEARTAIVGDED